MSPSSNNLPPLSPDMAAAIVHQPSFAAGAASRDAEVDELRDALEDEIHARYELQTRIARVEALRDRWGIDTVGGIALNRALAVPSPADDSTPAYVTMETESVDDRATVPSPAEEPQQETRATEAAPQRPEPTWEGYGPCPVCGRVTYAIIHSCKGIPPRPVVPVQPEGDGNG